jgi:hypothetical protein
MPTDERRFLLCTGQTLTFDDLQKGEHFGHILGEFRYLTEGDARVTVLAVFDHALHLGRLNENHTLADRAQIHVWLVGDARGLRCNYPGCQRAQRWEMSKSALKALFRKHDIDLVV